MLDGFDALSIGFVAPSIAESLQIPVKSFQKSIDKSFGTVYL